ncbi:MAG TPA: hypothetical protein VKP88_01980 [Candidatus Paceibacterota bacterium]|nr:hypothetical protein [Candidatus Paceibacterota bacterium]
MSSPIYSDGVNLTWDEYNEILMLSGGLETELEIAQTQLDEQRQTLTRQSTTIQELQTQLTTVDTRLEESEKYFLKLESERNSLQTWNNILIGTTVTGLVTSMLLLMLR